MHRAPFAALSLAAALALPTAARAGDLQVKSVRTMVAGTSVTFVLEVCNQGGPSGPVSARFWLHRAAAPGCNAPGADAEEPAFSMPADACLEVAFEVPGFPDGRYKAWLMLDATCVLRETDESNNARGADYTVAAGTIAPRLTRFTVQSRPDAVCMDGSPAVFYRRAGTGAGRDRWIINLQGGGNCRTIAECAARPQRLRSSVGAPDTIAQGGLMDPAGPTNAAFRDWNHVYVSYCSSDLWSGNRGPSAATGGFSFRGSEIVTAVIAQLKDAGLTPGPTLATAKEVIFSGTSAGGFGVLANLDKVAAMLPGVKVRGLCDAGWYADFTLPGSGARFSSTFDALGALYGTEGDASCAAAQPAGARGRCLVGEVVRPYLTTPMFVHISQVDTALVVNRLLRAYGGSDPLAFAASYAAEVRRSLAPLTGAFSEIQLVHVAIMSGRIDTITIGGTSLRTVFENWYFGRPGPKKLVQLP